MLQTASVPAAPASAAARWRTPLTLVIVALVVLSVNLIHSGRPSLWGDEAASVMSATRPYPSLFHMLTSVDAVHGLYYLGLHVWVDIFGSSPFSVRFPSAIAVAFTSAVVTWIGFRLRGSLLFGALAGLFAGFLPRMAHSSLEARSYAFDALLASLLIVLTIEIVRRKGVDTKRLWVWYAVVLAVSVLAFLYMGLMSVAVAGILFWTKASAREWLRWLIASIVTVVALSPFVVMTILQRNQVAFLADVDRVNVGGIFVEPFFDADEMAIVAWAVILVGVLVWLLRKPTRTLSVEAVALAWMVLPFAVVLLGGFIVPNYSPRYMTYTAPAVGLLLAAAVWSVGELGLRRARALKAASVVVAAAMVVGLVLVAVPVWHDQRGPYAKRSSDWTQVSAFFRTHAQPGDAIIFNDSTSNSWRPRLALDTDPKSFAKLNDVTLKTPYQKSDLWFAEVWTPEEVAKRGGFDGVTRVWSVQVTGRGFKPRDQASTYGVDTLRSLGFNPVEHKRYKVSDITLFERPLPQQ